MAHAAKQLKYKWATLKGRKTEYATPLIISGKGGDICVWIIRGRLMIRLWVALSVSNSVLN